MKWKVNNYSTLFVGSTIAFDKADNINNCGISLSECMG